MTTEQAESALAVTEQSWYRYGQMNQLRLETGTSSMEGSNGSSFHQGPGTEATCGGKGHVEGPAVMPACLTGHVRAHTVLTGSENHILFVIVLCACTSF
jgi:hypothetical protein